MTDKHDEKARERFEAWYAKTDARFWNTSDAAFAAWCAAERGMKDALRQVERETRASERSLCILECKDAIRETLERFSEIHRFLQGEGPLEGVWFGDKPTEDDGPYWWRKQLRALTEKVQEGE